MTKQSIVHGCAVKKAKINPPYSTAVPVINNRLPAYVPAYKKSCIRPGRSVPVGYLERVRLFPLDVAGPDLQLFTLVRRSCTECSGLLPNTVRSTWMQPYQQCHTAATVSIRVAEPEPPRSRFYHGAGATTGRVSSGSDSGSGFSCWQSFKNLKIVMKTHNIRSRMLKCEFLLNF